MSVSFTMHLMSAIDTWGLVKRTKYPWKSKRCDAFHMELSEKRSDSNWSLNVVGIDLDLNFVNPFLYCYKLTVLKFLWVIFEDSSKSRFPQFFSKPGPMPKLNSTT